MSEKTIIIDGVEFTIRHNRSHKRVKAANDTPTSAKPSQIGSQTQPKADK